MNVINPQSVGYLLHAERTRKSMVKNVTLHRVAYDTLRVNHIMSSLSSLLHLFNFLLHGKVNLMYDVNRVKYGGINRHCIIHDGGKS